jgi:hypothetical protein
MKSLLHLVVLAAVCLSPLAAQLRFTGLEALEAKAKESVNVSLDSSTLQLASRFLSATTKGNDAVSADLLKDLKSISVRVFEFDREGIYKPEDLQGIRGQLREPVWKKIIGTIQGKETLDVYTKTEQGKMAGLALIATESRQLTVISIEGAIDLAALASLSGKLGIPDLSLDQFLNKGKSK